MTDAITIQNPRNRGGSTGHVLAKRSVTFTEIRNCGEASVGDAVSKLPALLPETEWGGASVGSPLVAYLDGECNLRSVELHLHPPCQVGLAVSCSLLTARPALSGMGQFDVKAREASR